MHLPIIYTAKLVKPLKKTCILTLFKMLGGKV